MLRIVQQRSSAAAKAYYSKADYLSEGQELVGAWGGKAAAMLGLEGKVQKEAFDRLCDNRHPANDNRLTPRTKDERTAGYDFNFSVSKSVSSQWALTQDAGILEAFREAVDETMREIEAEMQVRVRKKGQEEGERGTGNAAWATFYHFTSRPEGGRAPDPHIHAHCFMFNFSWDEQEQQFKAGQFRELKRDAPMWQAIFRAKLATKLQDRGYSLDITGGDFEIRGVPESVRTKNSTRTHTIERKAKDAGITDPAKKGALGAKTRARKDTTLTWEELLQAWDAKLAPQERAAIWDTHDRRAPGERPAPRHVEAVDYALRHCFEREAVVDVKQLQAEALRRGLGAVTMEAVRQELARRPLIVREINGRQLATTPAILAEETHMLEMVRAGRGTCAPLAGYRRPISRDWLNADQRKAVKHLWESPDRVLFLRGAAGVGKTTLLQEAKEGIEAAGHRVIALAPTAAASRGVLRQEGFDGADTLARFFVDEKMQAEARGQVIVLDEAGLVGGRDMAKLVAMTEKLDARLALVGDVRQHSAAGAYGSPLRLLEAESGSPVIEVSEIRRQKGSYKAAVEKLRDGNTAAAIEQLDALGWLKEVPEEERYRLLAEDYLRSTAPKKEGGEGKTALVVSPTHKEAELVTEAVREGLKAKGMLTGERELSVWRPLHLTEAERGHAGSYRPGDMLQFHQHAPGIKGGSRVLVEEGKTLPLGHAARFQAFRPAAIPVAAGDTLRVTANGKTKDGKRRLDNGMLLKVKGFTEDGDLVTDKRWIIARDWGHLAHGVCVTSHSAQGRTVDKVLIAQSAHSLGASGREQFYVSASRGKSEAAVYCESKEDLLAAVRRSEQRLTATELTAPAKGGWRERCKKLAFLRRCATLARSRDTQVEKARPSRDAGREMSR